MYAPSGYATEPAFTYHALYDHNIHVDFKDAVHRQVTYKTLYISDRKHVLKNKKILHIFNFNVVI